jgi:ribosomal-protein-alanine N-acetyltransferase
MNTFCKATTADRSSIQKLFNDIANHVKPTSMFNWTAKAIDDELDHGLFYVGRSSSGDTVAFIAYRETDDSIEIMALGTAERFLQQGIMLELLMHFVQFFSKKGKSIHLEVHSANEKAIMLYKKCGFETLRIRKAYYADGADALVMHYKADCL